MWVLDFLENFLSIIAFLSVSPLVISEGVKRSALCFGYFPLGKKKKRTR